ncbi:cutinase family protein [Streptomyces griseus]|uniref:cutinase family protein n=1 Tax=Streptomyces griseus TaxID=1911 RepID=UPI00131B3A25|nr:cutinase family protein [Streptomyces griseus]
MFRELATCFGAAILFFGMATPQATVNARQQIPEDCRDFYFLGGHGLGEGGIANWGSTVQGVYENYVKEMNNADPDVSIDSEAIEYPRTEFPEFGPKGLLREWIASERDEVVEGAIALNKQITDRIGHCRGRERYILAGFSQGAWVIHRFLKDAPQSIVDKISGVAVLGDPQYARTGIIPKVFPGYEIKPYFPPGIRYQSLCLSYDLPAAGRAVNDPICRFSRRDFLTRGDESDLKNCEAAAKGAINTVWCPHLRYVQTGGTKRIADFLVSVS